MRPSDVDPAQGVFGISVAADLVGMDPQSLRLYERRGLLEPARTDGGTRRYSSDDLARLQRIGYLLAAGLNLAGIAKVLELETENARLRAALELTHDADMARTSPLTRPRSVD
ncbi:MerR family transcriptional regulator [Pseudofrankia inefficax]|uniref:Transcriptional regulator, MerR family n=1 Tax=Pseudofrankia inefficax (strain DSM 45817 / CECT 9037 / DDB 130130 / EuI1c) TaxID=298654 RepID=E3J8E4_PSEI1|nr:helix-turn-helix transcriptional regulator [Pseudofrankia inefficax]ADP84478.1 transcriptional regulator, MerR family [Pseudofrankia inefficax]